jgi:hypothetical protein
MSNTYEEVISNLIDKNINKIISFKKSLDNILERTKKIADYDIIIN